MKGSSSASASTNVSVLRDERPFNFPALNNSAVSQARGEIIGLVNPCIEVITPEWLTEMVSHALRPQVACVGAKLLYRNNTVRHAGLVLGIGGVVGHAHIRLSKNSLGYFGRASLTQAFSAVSATCLVIRKDVYQELDGLDEENLATDFNDVDLCLRAGNAGYQNIFTPYADLYQHKPTNNGATDPTEKPACVGREAQYIKRRWGEKLLNDQSYNPNLTLDFEDFSLAWPPRVAAL